MTGADICSPAADMRIVNRTHKISAAGKSSFFQ
jgi:hypothetical protein